MLVNFQTDLNNADVKMQAMREDNKRYFHEVQPVQGGSATAIKCFEFNDVCVSVNDIMNNNLLHRMWRSRG